MGDRREADLPGRRRGRKLPGGSGGGSYTLPTASADTLGGIKVGENISIAPDGTLSAEEYDLVAIGDGTVAITLGGNHDYS